MNQTEVKERLYDAAVMFFAGATVIWAEQAGTRPGLPYVTLKMGGIRRAAFPAEDGAGIRSYPCNTTMEVNLYTGGQPVSEGEAVTGNCINTATADLMEFSNFLESEAMVDFFAVHSMDVSLIPPVRDVSLLQNDSRYRYRAMAEYQVAFVQDASGRYALKRIPLVPNSSGGGLREQSGEEVYAIEETEIKEEKALCSDERRRRV